MHQRFRGLQAASLWPGPKGELIPDLHTTLAGGSYPNDPIAKQYLLFKHGSSPVSPTLYGRLELHISRQWGMGYFVARLLAHTLLLMGWHCLAPACPWRLLSLKLDSVAGCWRPHKRDVAVTGFCMLSGGKPNLHARRGYLRLSTVKGPHKSTDEIECIAQTKRTVYAHQIMCWAMHGPPPSDPQQAVLVRHLCGKPSCINPNCLEWGTPQQNADDRSRHKKSRKLKGVCKQ